MATSSLVIKKKKSKMKRKWNMQWRPILEKKRFVPVPAEAHKSGKTYPFYRNSLHFTRDSCLDLFKYETFLEHVSRREDRKTRG